MKHYYGRLFYNQYLRLKRIINEHIPNQKERKHRIDALTLAYEKNDPNRFLQLAHEIESFVFLLGVGSIALSRDSKSKSGADIVLNSNIYIECVCCTGGKENGKEKANLDLLSRAVTFDDMKGEQKFKTGLFDQRALDDIVNARITNALFAKLKMRQEQIDKKVLRDDFPYLIFLSYGTLYDNVADDPERLKEVLFGRDLHQIHINRGTGKFYEDGFSHRDAFQKTNGATLDCNLFLAESFRCISGILLATEQQLYTDDNVVLYINPNALNKIDKTTIPVSTIL